MTLCEDLLGRSFERRSRSREERMRQWLIRSCAAGLATTLTAATQGGGDLLGEWWQAGPQVYKYAYLLKNSPDFDQVRSGLPGCGLNYCVPTATANLLAWISNHGFADVGPGLEDWSSPASYAAMTDYLKYLGQRMGTNPSSGTKKSNWYYSLTCPFGGACIQPLLPPKTFTVTAMFAKDEYRPRLYVAAKAAIENDGLLAVIHGWYDNGNCPEWAPSVREGGHCLSLRTADGYWVPGAYQYQADVGLHDPASDEGFWPNPPASDPCDGAKKPAKQSPFAVNYYDLSLEDYFVPYFVGGGCWNAFDLDRLYVSGDGTDTFRLVDAYLMIALKSGYSFSPSEIKKIYGAAYLPATTVPEPKTVAVANGVAAAALAPDLESIVAIADSALRLIDPLVATVAPYPEGDYFVKNPVAVTFGRDGGLYVAHDGGIVWIESTDFVPIQKGSAVPPSPCVALGYCDLTDSVYALAAIAGGAQLLRYPADLSGAPTAWALPAVQLGANPTLMTDPTDGSLWIGHGSASLIRVLLGGRVPVIQTWPLLGDATPVGGFDVDSAGNLIASRGNVLQEYERDPQGNQWLPVANSAFNGKPGGDVFLVTRSRTNLDPAIHDMPEWDDIFPPTLPPPSLTCLGDIDGSGDVGAPDLAILLGSWGNVPAGDDSDLDGDAMVGPADIAILLGAWGPCPPEPEPEPILSVDSCQTASLVEGGTHLFSTLEASADGPTLPASCDEGAGLSFGPDIWALYVPPTSGTVTVSTCGAVDFDSRLAAYVGLCANPVLIGCNDDASGCPGFSSRMGFPAAQGEPVLIRIGGYGSAVGTGSVSISIDPTIVADACNGALPIGEGAYPFSTFGATSSGPDLPGECNEGSGLSFAPDVWALYLPTANGVATLSTCGAASYDTRLAAYRFDCENLALLGCNDDASGCGLTSSLTVPVTAGVPVRVRIGGFGSAVGNGTLTITQP
jgi:hypothetical protein